MGTVVQQHESNMRSIMKSITFRILATITTIILVYIFFGHLELAAVIGGLEIVLKLVLYFFHERAWDRITWGKIPMEG